MSKPKRIRLTNSTEAARKLLLDVRREPYDEAARLVLADWCEEKGIGHAAEVLRMDPDEAGVALLSVLSGMRALFGEGEDVSRALGRYPVVLGLPIVEIASGDTHVLDVASMVSFRLRRLVLSSEPNVRAELYVLDFRLGIQSIFCSSEPVQASMFQLLAPELFDAPCFPGQRIVITYENRDQRDMTFGGCLLGVTTTF